MTVRWSERVRAMIGRPDQDPLTTFMRALERAGTSPARNMVELRQRNHRAAAGLAFEEFGVRYCRCVLGLARCWRLPDAPADVLASLGLRRQDLGIDLVGFDDRDRAYAVQCRFRARRTGRASVLTWRSLATFFALAATTGPYERWIVLTTADYVRRGGRRTPRDRTVGYRSLKRLTRFQWLDICSDEPRIPSNHVGTGEGGDDARRDWDAPNLAFLRARRLARFAGNIADDDTSGRNGDGDTSGRNGDGDTSGRNGDGDTSGRNGDGDGDDGAN